MITFSITSTLCFNLIIEIMKNQSLKIPIRSLLRMTYWTKTLVMLLLFIFYCNNGLARTHSAALNFNVSSGYLFPDTNTNKARKNSSNLTIVNKILSEGIITVSNKVAKKSNALSPGIYTAIPDAVFEARLISLGIDSGTIDNQVLTSAIASVTTLNAGDSTISDLTGIRDFTSLQYLNCFNSNITSLDVSGLTNLLRVNSYQDYFLTTVTLTGCTLLNYINFGGCPLTTISFAGLSAMKTIDMNSFNISSLDLSSCNVLSNVAISSNSLQNLNLSGLTNMSGLRLNVAGNNLTCIQVDNVATADQLSFCSACTPAWRKPAGASYSTNCYPAAVPTAPTATAQTFCASGTVANLVASGTSLKWYDVATNGTALVSTTAIATGTYYVSQTVSSSESARTSVAVTVNTTAAPTAAAQTFCTSVTVANLVATGTSLQWYAVAINGTALSASTALATGTYYVTQTLNGCESARTSVSVTVNTTAAPTATAQTFCTSGTVANLVASGTNLKWYNVATNGTALVSTTTLATGTYYVSQTLNSCESARTSVSVTVNATTARPTAAAQTFCVGATVANLLVTTGLNLKWYATFTSVTPLAASTVLATQTYYVTQTLNGCESTKRNVDVTVNTTVAPTAAAQTFCISGTVANLVATGTSLKWYNVATNGTALVSTTTLATGTYYVSQTLNSCESTRTSVAVTVNTSNIWSGATSTAWNVATNWSCGVPLSGDAIEIPSGLTNYPVLDGPRTIGNTNIVSGATLNLNNATLVVAGTFSGTGTLIGSSTSGLTINGLGNQGTFYMNQTTLGTSNKLANFTLNSTVSGSATLGNAMDISGILTLTNGTFNTGGNLTLTSDGSGTAVVAPILNCVNVAITGDVTAERFFPGKRAFRLISSPVTTTTSIKANWQEGVNNPTTTYANNLNPKLGYGTHITGSIIGGNGFDATQTTANSMFTFSNTARVWAAVPNTNVLTLTAGVPYRLMIRGSRLINMNINNPTADDTTLRAKGALKICEASAGVLSETSGVLSFVGNPYQAIVDIKDVLTNSTNLNSNSYQVWDPKASTRGAYIIYDLVDSINATFGSAVNQYLQPWQACFVATNSAGSANITFNELNKVTNSQVIAGVYRTNNLASYIRLTLYESNTLASNGAAADGLIVKFGENYVNAIDGYDALKLSNIDETFSTKNNTSLVGIESRLSPVASDIIPLNIAQYRFTNYTMVANGTNMSGLPAYLHDQLSQTYTEIPQSGSVNYSYVLDTNNAATSASDRFRIVFENPTLSIESNAALALTISPNPSKQGVFDVVMNGATADTKLVIYNTIGQEVYATNLMQATINHINPNKVFANGVYYVKIKKDAVTTIKKLIIR